ncbi:MAG: hypothetical protein FJ006_11890 [Chloroflexi bacterium]|nr:hypothetical protein [Chloroflexota bacterium]
MTYGKLVRAGELYRALQEEETIIERIKNMKMPFDNLLADEVMELETALNEFKEKTIAVVQLTFAKHRKEFEEL